MRIAARHRMLANIQHQIRSVNAPYRGMLLQLSHPNHRHSVRRDEQRAIKNPNQLRIALRLHYTMNSGDGDVAAFSSRDCVEKKIARTLLIENTDPDSKHVDLFN